MQEAAAGRGAGPTDLGDDVGESFLLEEGVELRVGEFDPHADLHALAEEGRQAHAEAVGREVDELAVAHGRDDPDRGAARHRPASILAADLQVIAVGLDPFRQELLLLFEGVALIGFDQLLVVLDLD